MKFVNPLLLRLVARQVLTSGTALLLLACNGIDGVDDPSGNPKSLIPDFAFVPQFETFHEDVIESVASCDGFEVVRHVVDDASYTTFFDRQGVPLRVSIHVVEDNTLTNSTTNKYVRYPGVLNITIDVPSGVTRVTGTPIHITVPGEGNFVFDAGIVIFDQAGNMIFQGGPHPFLEAGAADPHFFCSLLR